VYLIVVYWLSVRLALVSTLAWATAAWMGCAAVVLIGWTRLHPSGG